MCQSCPANTGMHMPSTMFAHNLHCSCTDSTSRNLSCSRSRCHWSQADIRKWKRPIGRDTCHYSGMDWDCTGSIGRCRMDPWNPADSCIGQSWDRVVSRRHCFDMDCLRSSWSHRYMFDHRSRVSTGNWTRQVGLTMHDTRRRSHTDCSHTDLLSTDIGDLFYLSRNLHFVEIRSISQWNSGLPSLTRKQRWTCALISL